MRCSCSSSNSFQEWDPMSQLVLDFICYPLSSLSTFRGLWIESKTRYPIKVPHKENCSIVYLNL